LPTQELALDLFSSLIPSNSFQAWNEELRLHPHSWCEAARV